MKNTDNNEVLNSHRFNKNGIEFPAPSYYLQPIIQFLNDSPEGLLTVQGDDPDEVTDQSTGQKLTAYRKVSLIKTFDVDTDLTYQIGFVYALDIGKPIIKVFSGINVRACTNLCVFGADKKQEFLIANNTEGASLLIQNYIQSLHDDIVKAKQTIHEMKNTFFNEVQVEKLLGDFLMNFSRVNNIAGTQCLLDGAKFLTDKSSMYYFEKQTNAWNIYNAFTHNICNKKHILQQPEKVYSLFAEMKKHREFHAETLQAQLN